MLIEHLLESVRRRPNKRAANDPLRPLTYSQLSTFAQAIRRLVLKETRQERVGVLLPASTAGLGVLVGTVWSGKTVVPLNFLLQPGELSAVIADAQIDLVITTEHFDWLMRQTPVRALYLEKLFLKTRYAYEKFRRTPEPPQVSPEDLAAIVYTSGTTGLPKGVCLTHENLLSNCRAAIEHLRITSDHHLLGVLPPFHVFGLTVLKFLPIVLGATVTYIPRFSPQAAYRAIELEGITILLAVPSMYGAIARLKDLDATRFKRLHLAVSGGEPLPRTVYNQMYERTGVRLMEGYGLTETSPVLSCDVPWDHRVGTVGMVLPDVETQLRDQAGGVRANGREGELFVRGPMVMKGYFHRPEETEAVIDRDGWFRTGDIVEIGDDGHVSITGRAKDLILVGGENVFPREVELALEQHPAIADVAVIGQQDGSRGEVVVGFVALREDVEATAEELRSFCRDQLAGYKVPRKIHIRRELPRGPTGKILKRELRALLTTA